MTWTAVEHPWIEYCADSIFVVRFPEDHSLQELQSAFDEIERISASAVDSYGFIVDLTELSHSSAEGKIIVQAAEKRLNEMPSVRLHCRGLAQVVRTQMQREAMSAVNFFVKRPYKSAVFMTFDEAQRWMEHRLTSSMPYSSRRPASL